MAEGVVGDLSAKQVKSGLIASVRTWPPFLGEVGTTGGF